jgi:predicted Zn-dependent protease with MMP-like domain
MDFESWPGLGLSHGAEKIRQTRRRGFGCVAYQFRKRMQNVSVLVEYMPPEQRAQRGSRNSGIADASDLDNFVLGVFEGVPATQKSAFEVPVGPDRIVLYQKNIEAVCSNEEEIRREIHLTIIHELGHYFGMTEAQLEGI